MRNSRDFYPTPYSIINVLLSRLEWPASVVWEPCEGDGRLAGAMRFRGAEVIGHDIVTGQFIDHAFDIGVERMALICNERLWACQRGYEQWNRHRPSRFANLTWREDYLNKGGSPDRSLAISIWDTPHSETCQYEVWDKN